MTAPSAKVATNTNDQSADPSVRQIGQACQTANDGRRAAQALGRWSKRFQLTEPELQILWRLREAAASEFDQTTLAAQLAFSPAQISACVEKLRVRKLIMHREAPGDRRRRFWQLSAGGSDLLHKIMQAADRLAVDARLAEMRTASAGSGDPRTTTGEVAA